MSVEEQVSVKFERRYKTIETTREVLLPNLCGWSFLIEEVLSAFKINSFESQKCELLLVHVPTDEAIGGVIHSEAVFWKLYSEVYVNDETDHKFVIQNAYSCSVRFFLSFDLYCHKLIAIPINSTWKTIVDTVALKFVNLTSKGIESFVFMTGQNKEEDLIDFSQHLTTDEAFWCAFTTLQGETSSSSDILNVKIIGRPAYTIPLALAEDSTLKSSIKLDIYEKSWSVVTELISATFELKRTCLEVVNVSLTDEDGDVVGSVITSAPDLYKRFSKSFNPSDDTIKFLVHCRSIICEPSSFGAIDSPSVSALASVFGADQTFLCDFRGNIHLHGICDNDLTNAAVFHISSAYEWKDIIHAFCTALSLCSPHLISHFQIWDANGNNVGPPLESRDSFIAECKRSYLFTRGMFVAVVQLSADNIILESV